MKKIFTLFDWIESKETWVIKNMTKVVVFIILLLIFLFLFQQTLWFINWYFQIGIPLGFNYISLLELLSFLGIITAFWYGYKRYERDKDIEILQKFRVEENTIIVDYKEFLNNLELLHVYNKKDYINDDYYNILLQSYLEKLDKLEYDKDPIGVFFKLRLLKKYAELFPKILESLESRVTSVSGNDEWLRIEQDWVKICEEYSKSLEEAISLTDDLINISKIFEKKVEEYEAQKEKSKLKKKHSELSKKAETSKKKLFMYYTYKMLKEIN